jgi:hypothetical protein
MITNFKIFESKENIIKIKDVFYKHDNEEDFVNDLKNSLMGKDVSIIEEYKNGEWQEIPDCWGWLKIDDIKWISKGMTMKHIKERKDNRFSYVVTINNILNLSLSDVVRIMNRKYTEEDPYGEEDWEDI